jgi:hypothetical protein
MRVKLSHIASTLKARRNKAQGASAESAAQQSPGRKPWEMERGNKALKGRSSKGT